MLYDKHMLRCERGPPVQVAEPDITNLWVRHLHRGECFDLHNYQNRSGLPCSHQHDAVPVMLRAPALTPEQLTDLVDQCANLTLNEPASGDTSWTLIHHDDFCKVPARPCPEYNVLGIAVNCIDVNFVVQLR